MFILSFVRQIWFGLLINKNILTCRNSYQKGTRTKWNEIDLCKQQKQTKKDQWQMLTMCFIPMENVFLVYIVYRHVPTHTYLYYTCNRTINDIIFQKYLESEPECINNTMPRKLPCMITTLPYQHLDIHLPFKTLLKLSWFSCSILFQNTDEQ